MPVSLSIIVARCNASCPPEQILDPLLSQIDEGVEVVWVDGSVDDSTQLVRERYPAVRVVRQEPASLVPVLWAEGIRQSRGEIVALTTSHFVPAQDWVDRLQDAHRHGAAGIGGAIDPEPSGSWVDWAVYFSRYTRYGVASGRERTHDIAADNASYQRVALEACPQSWSEGFWEPPVHAALRGRGGELWLQSEIRMRHVRSFGLATFARQRFLHGTRFGSERTLRIGPARRWLYALASPLIPFLYLSRIAGLVFHHRFHRGRFLKCVPLMCLFFTAWAAGECWGYVRGEAGEGAGRG